MNQYHAARIERLVQVLREAPSLHPDDGDPRSSSMHRLIVLAGLDALEARFKLPPLSDDDVRN